MDILPLHIEYLLTRHDCVIVPGLGAFIASESEARIDAELGIVTPRRREISFNGSVVTDDGLLAHSIARRERISYEEARRMLTSLTEKMNFDLRREGEVSVGLVGRLLRDSEGMVSFEPRRRRAGSEISRAIRLARISAPGEEQTAEAVGQPAAASFATPAETTGDGSRLVRVAPDRYVFTISKRAAHAAAMLVAVLTIGLSLMIPVNHDKEQKASVVPIGNFFPRSVSGDAPTTRTDLSLPQDSISISPIEDN